MWIFKNFVRVGWNGVGGGSRERSSGGGYCI